MPTRSSEAAHSTILRRYAVKIVETENIFLWLNFFYDADQEVTDACKARVLKTMKEFPSSVDVQINCCTVLSNIALSGRRRCTVGMGSSIILLGNGRHTASHACCSV